MSDALHVELAGGIVSMGSTYHNKIFKSSVADRCIEDFISRTPYYDQGRWHTIPKKPNDEKALYTPFIELLGHILAYFKYNGRGRKLVDTHNIDIPHKDLNRHGSADDSSRCRTSPDFMILGSGANLNTEENNNEIRASYALCASPGEIKTERNQKDMMNTDQVAVYARQCFIEQHHRRFVYSIILTEKKARLFLFDRSGAIQSQRFNIHEQPGNFVRIVLGFCSTNNQKIGFDTNIFWRNNSRYITLHNHWEVKGLGMREYRVAEGSSAIAFSRNTMRGRGTVCWNVVDCDGTPFLIKDSWRSAGREPECKLLAEVAGVAGVGQMVTYQDNGQDDVAQFRDVPNCDLTESLSHNRIFSRIVLEAYGKPLDYFNNRRHLLFAFRDAVNGHRNLWRDKHILHRDVSINNILHGKEGSVEGSRGVLIDLDMAICLTRQAPLTGTFRTGTRAFQSITVLRSEKNGEHARPHDYLDDLESFFYVFAWICSTYTGPHERLESEPRALVAWQEDVVVAIGMKTAFLYDPTTELTPYFECFSALLTSLGNFLIKHATRKEKECRSKAPKVPLMDLLAPSDAEYDTFLGFVDDAIAALEPEETDPVVKASPSILKPEPITPPHSLQSQDTPFHTPATPRTPGTARKRRTEEVDNSPTAGKKNKFSSGIPESPSVGQNR
ncbi:hypothetical protein JR316_0011815 [Psilocybe cubensis]|nr:hypothetical protein JR316_0011815 [Psilocybe cubensis]KAH9476244.1 hypothetical protein JR316_0011815 [Psilocybe cubensis]